MLIADRKRRKFRRLTPLLLGMRAYIDASHPDHEEAQRRVAALPGPIIIAEWGDVPDAAWEQRR